MSPTCENAQSSLNASGPDTLSRPLSISSIDVDAPHLTTNSDDSDAEVNNDNVRIGGTVTNEEAEE
jgi:hypothetical protein